MKIGFKTKNGYTDTVKYTETPFSHNNSQSLWFLIMSTHPRVCTKLEEALVAV